MERMGSEKLPMIYPALRIPFILSMCITDKGDLEQIRKDGKGLEIKMKDMGSQALCLSLIAEGTGLR